ncbi:MAG: hypothetical protein LUD22_01690 [Coprobacillus sp.]|nr:hypothetical protein [Coprobacillus sp.]
MSKKGYEVVIAVVNSGFSEKVVEAARSVGAKGGTIIHGRGTTSLEVLEDMGLTISPEKEVVLIVVSESIKDAVLQAINLEAGLATNGNGIAMSIPCSEVVGLTYE